MVDNVEEYPSGLPCAHCMWVHDDYRKKGRRRVPIMTRNLITENDYTSVYKSGFKYSLSFVLKEHESGPGDIHNFINNVMDYVRVLKEWYNIRGVLTYNILLNYGYKKDLSSREHLHLFVTFKNANGTRLFDELTDTQGGYISKKFQKTVVDELYDTDTIKPLTYDELMNYGMKDIFQTDSGRDWQDKQSIYILLKIKIDNQGYSEFIKGQYSYPEIKRRGSRGGRKNNHNRQ